MGMRGMDLSTGKHGCVHTLPNDTLRVGAPHDRSWEVAPTPAPPRSRLDGRTMSVHLPTTDSVRDIKVGLSVCLPPTHDLCYSLPPWQQAHPGCQTREPLPCLGCVRLLHPLHPSLSCRVTASPNPT
jgi:hypothetical protein